MPFCAAESHNAEPSVGSRIFRYISPSFSRDMFYIYRPFRRLMGNYRVHGIKWKTATTKKRTTMKITELKIHVLKSPLAEPFAFSQGWVRQRSATLLEIFTDEGITGWGEAFAQGLEPPEIAAPVIDKALKPLLIGAVPLDIEDLWHRMYHMTRHPWRHGPVS